MKTFVPRKYKLVIHLMGVVAPIIIALVIIITRTFNNLTYMVLGACATTPVVFPRYFNRSVTISGAVIFDLDKNTVTNNMMDGTPEQPNFGWTESLDNIKKVHLVAKETAKKYDPNTYAKKAILLNLGEKGYKTIRVESFNNDELCDILDLLQQKKPVDSEKQE